MTLLDGFALFVLIVLAATVVGVYVTLTILPGKIATSRKHPRAAAIKVCAWWGFFTGGLLLPIAWIWAYTHPKGAEEGSNPSPQGDAPRHESGGS